MPPTVNIGTLEGLLRWKADDAELTKSLDEVAAKADVSKNQVKQYNRELNAITSSYNKVAASLDPVVANTQKYERAERASIAALKAGIITQEQHNRTLSQAKEKYLSSSASVLTWREEMQRLTNVITPFASRLADISVLVKDLTGALGASAHSATAAAGGVSTAGGAAAGATTSFAALGAVLLPLAPLLLAVGATAGSLYVGFKAFDFLKTAVIEGTKTQLVIEKLNIALRSNGSYAQMSAAEMVALAESYELLTGQSKEQIIAAETVLSRFDSLNKQTFPEALKVILAYSKATGEAADQSAKKLAPALGGNTRSLNTLKDIGITFTAAQRKMLTAMVETGDKAAYQAKLLEILREKIGLVSDQSYNNLTRQVDRAKIVLNDFGESIANEVIPALEDLFSELITSLGGWDALKKKVNEVGGAIGNFIRTSIYGLAIAFHELGIVIDRFIAGVAPKLAAFAKFNALMFSSPGLLRASQELDKAGKSAKTSALDHGEAIERLTKGLLGHRKALEGDTETYEAYGLVLDDIIGKSKELERLTQELTDIYAKHSLELQRIYDLRMLAAQGMTDPETRLAQEKKINEAHEDRVKLLELEKKFGTDIAKSLLEVEKGLRNKALKAKIELALSVELRTVNFSTEDIRKQFEQLSKISTENLDKVIANENQNREEFKKSSEAYDSLIDQTASNWLESFKSMKDVAQEEMSYVREAVNRGLLTVAEGERAIAEIRAQMYSGYIDQWTGFLSYLGDSLGGFFAELASIGQAVQRVDSTAQSLGGWSSVAGAFGGTIAAFVELYKYADAVITKHKGEKYGTRSDYNVMGGVDLSGYGNFASLELSHQIKKILDSLEDSLRISAQDLASLEIRVSNDGKQTQAWVKGVWIGTFEDTNTAIREALLVAMKDPSSNLRGMSELMLAGMADWTSPDMGGMLEFLETLRAISDLDLSPSVTSLHQSFIEINRMREALDKLDQSSQVVIDAHNSLTAAQKRLYDQTVNSMLGIDTAAADRVRDLVGFQKGIGDVAGAFEDGIKGTIHAIEEQIKALEKAEARSGQLGEPGGGGARPKEGGGSQGGDLIARLFSDTTGEVLTEKERLQRELKAWTEKLGEVPKALSDQQIDLGIFTAVEDDLRRMGKHSGLIKELDEFRIKVKYEELRLQLVALGAWERWAGIWQDLYNQAMAGAGKGLGNVGRGTGGTDKDSVKDFIKNKEFELSLVGLTAYQKSLKELDKQYDDLIKQAGKDKKLKDELLALKEKELRLLEQETKRDLAGKFREFLGLVTPFDKVRKTSSDLIKEIEASPFGNARKAQMIGRILAETERQLDRLAKETAVNLFGSMLSDMEKFGATEAQMAEIRKIQAIFEHEIRLANYLLTITQLEAEGRLSAEIINKMKEGYNFLASIDPTKFITPATPPGGDISTYSSLADSSNELYDILKSVQDKIAEWNRESLSEVLSRAHELSDSFAELMKDINKIKALGPEWDYTIQAQEAYANLVRNFIDETLGEFETSGSEINDRLSEVGRKFADITAAFIHLGATEEDLLRAEEARLRTVGEILSEYLDPLREFRERQNFGPMSLLSGEEQFLAAQNKFRELFEQIQSGDLSNLEDVLASAETYEELLHSFTAGEGVRFGMKEINDALLAIEEIVPGFAEEIASAELGSGTDNPLYMETSAMTTAIDRGTEAVNMGNNLILIEQRKAVDGIKDVSTKIETLNDTISNGISVINISQVA